MRSTGKFQVITIGRMLSYQILSEGNEGKKKFEYLLHIIKCVFVLPAQVIHNHGCMVPTRTARDCMDENPCTVPWILPCMCHWVVQLTEFPWNGRGSMALFTCYNYPRWDCFNTSSRWVLKPARRPYNAHCRHRTHHGGSKNSGKYGAPKNFSPVFLDSSCKTRQVGGDQYHMNWVPYTCESDVHIIQTHGWLVELAQSRTSDLPKTFIKQFGLSISQQNSAPQNYQPLPHISACDRAPVGNSTRTIRCLSTSDNAFQALHHQLSICDGDPTSHSWIFCCKRSQLNEVSPLPQTFHLAARI